MTIAFAAGVDRVRGPGRGTTWPPRLIAVLGAALLVDGVFRADPALGFPPGTPSGQGQISWHGAVHLVSASIGFACLITACLVIAHGLAAEGHRRWANYTRITAGVFLVSFVAIAAGGGSSWSNLTFVGGVLALFTWMSAIAVHLYRRAAP